MDITVHLLAYAHFFWNHEDKIGEPTVALPKVELPQHSWLSRETRFSLPKPFKPSPPSPANFRSSPHLQSPEKGYSSSTVRPAEFSTRFASVFCVEPKEPSSILSSVPAAWSRDLLSEFQLLFQHNFSHDFDVPASFPANFRRATITRPPTIDCSSGWLEGPNKVYIPILACRDHNGFDSDRSYPLPKVSDGTYKSLDPRQPPIAPPYKRALELKKALNNGNRALEKLSLDP